MYYNHISFIAIIILALFYALEILTRKRCKSIFWIMFTLFAVLILFKPFGAYPDDESYLGLLRLYENDALSAHNQGRDQIYYVFTHVLATLFPDQTALVLVSFVSYSIKAIILGKISRYSLGPFLLYAAYSIQLVELTSLRNSMATAFILMAIYFYLHREWFKTLVSYVVSLGFHINTILLLLLQTLPKRRIINNLIPLLLMLFVLGYWQPTPVFSITSSFQMAAVYLGQLESQSFEPIHVFRFSGLATILLLVLVFRTSEKSKINTTLFFGAILSQVTPFFLYWFPTLGGRLSDLCIPFLFAWIAFVHSRMNVLQRAFLLFISIGLSLNYIYVNPLFMRDM